mgnify:CR=1 FL=1
MTPDTPRPTLQRYGDQFEQHLREMRAQGASDAEIDRDVALEVLLGTIEDIKLPADDLRFLTVIAAMCWDKHPARLYAQLQRSGDGMDHPASGPVPPAGNPA